MRHAIRRGWFKPLLLLFTATRGRSYIDVEPITVRLRFGLFDETFPRSEIEAIEPGWWPPWYGIGWRVAPGKRLGLIGSLLGLVEIRLRHRRRGAFLGVPFTYQTVVVSLEDPQVFAREIAAGQPSGIGQPSGFEPAGQPA